MDPGHIHTYMQHHKRETRERKKSQEKIQRENEEIF